MLNQVERDMSKHAPKTCFLGNPVRRDMCRWHAKGIYIISHRSKTCISSVPQGLHIINTKYCISSNRSGLIILYTALPWWYTGVKPDDIQRRNAFDDIPNLATLRFGYFFLGNHQEDYFLNSNIKNFTIFFNLSRKSVHIITMKSCISSTRQSCISSNRSGVFCFLYTGIARDDIQA